MAVLAVPELPGRCRAATEAAPGSLSRSHRHVRKPLPFATSPADDLRSVALGSAALFYGSWIYINYTTEINKRYPPDVANKLRRALYYANQEVDPQKAAGYYRQALEKADEAGMNPMTDEILGIKLSYAGMLERIGLLEKAIDTLEVVRRDCEKFVLLAAAEERLVGERARVLRKVVQISVKLGDLYVHENVDDVQAAEASRVTAVEVLTKELLRREKEGVKEGEETWMSNEEMGATYEGSFLLIAREPVVDVVAALGEHFAMASKGNLSAPLFARALTFCPPSCHQASIMHNLSASLMAQLEVARAHDAPEAALGSLAQNATQWADKAIDVSRRIQPPGRSAECDVSCALATRILGRVAEILGRYEEAKQKYEEATALSKATDHPDAVEQSKNIREEIQRVDAKLSG